MADKVTRKDIARLAGTSVSVVSRALNRSGYVDEDKRRKILQIAKELNYIHDSSNTGVQEQKTKQIIFFCSDFRNPFYIQMYQGMLDAAKDTGYRILFDGNTKLDDIRELMTDGIIFPSKIAAAGYMNTYGKNYDIPVLCAAYGDVVDIKKSVTMVEIDMFKAVEMGMDYLWKMGHRRIVYATPYDRYSSRDAAYVGWLRDKHIDPEKYLIRIPFRPEQGYPHFDFRILGRLAAYEYVRMDNPATAILAFNDEYAYGIMDGLLENNLSIPEDVSVMGIDGTYTRQYMNTKLTTVSLFPEKQGALCVQTMINIIEKKPHKYITRIAPKIAEGNTVYHK